MDNMRKNPTTKSSKKSPSFLASAIGVAALCSTAANNSVMAGSGIRDGVTAAADPGSGIVSSDADTVVGNITSVAMWAVGIISVVIIIFSGIMYATAAGDESKTKKAQKALVGGIIGLAIAILALVIVNFVIKEVR
ncbi:pilin [Candidatus Saccharibacteria bacterium]|nr:pilin [Candidatus Saccharibacteria bacterium]